MTSGIFRYLRLVLIIVISGILFQILMTFSSSKLQNGLTVAYSDPPVRGIIATLIRSTNHSISLTINMMHSFLYFHRINGSYSYPFLIFHDENFTSIMRQQILSCVLRRNKHIKISFAPVSFNTEVTINPGSPVHKPIGYRLMCRFWTYDVFYHPAILQGKYDYIMRMDDDSYLSDVVGSDIFLRVKNQRLDYAYRTTYWENTPAMNPIVQRFINGTGFQPGCIYNNFFVMRLKWFYESKRIHSFIRELMQNNLMLREYIGDGCVHAVMLQLENGVKIERLSNIPYGHNFHLLPPGHQQATYMGVNAFYDEMNQSCHKFTILRGDKGQLIRIKLS
ncbi:unnamed protein product [Rotaria socialis]